MRKKKYIDHDRLFKELLQTFFEEFMVLFFPHVSEFLDFQHIKFLSQEVFTDVTEGEKRRIDLLVETKLINEPGLIIIHTETQSTYQAHFPQRMFIYYSRLYEKYQQRILPIAVFSYNKKKEEKNHFDISFPFHHVLSFEFLKVQLKRMNWKDYIHQENPIAAALLCKMNFKKEEKVAVKREFLRMIVRMELDPARNHLLAGFFDQYHILNESEEEELEKEIKSLNRDEAIKVMELKTAWEERGIEKGMITIINNIIQIQFPNSFESLQLKVNLIRDVDFLKTLANKLILSKDKEEIVQMIEQHVADKEG